MERFRYDAKNDLVRCPRKKVLTPRSTTKTGRWFRAAPDTCRSCPLRERCTPDAGPSRRVHISTSYVAVLRARRKRRAWGEPETRLYSRHRWLVEAAHGLAKTLHGMSRAARRGLENMKIQALLTATAINLKRLAKAILYAVDFLLQFRQIGQTIDASLKLATTSSTAPGGSFSRRKSIGFRSGE